MACLPRLLPAPEGSHGRAHALGSSRGIIRQVCMPYYNNMVEFQLPATTPKLNPPHAFTGRVPMTSRDRSRAQELGSSPFLLLYPRAGRGGGGCSRNTGIAAGTWTRTRSTCTWAHGTWQRPRTMRGERRERAVAHTRAREWLSRAQGVPRGWSAGSGPAPGIPRGRSAHLHLGLAGLEKTVSKASGR